MQARLAIVVCLSALAPGGMQSLDSRLQQAREALTGARKDTTQARKLLLEFAKKRGADPAQLCYAYVYLGYIEDLAENRADAVAWFTKALQFKEGGPGILAVAQHGLKEPVTWIRHLDPGRPQPPPGPAQVRIGKGYITTAAPPPGLALAKTLSEVERRENFETLWEAIDKTYACFELKSIDWEEVHQRYRKRLESVTDAEGFYSLLFQLVAELKDTHSWLQGYKPPPSAGAPGVAVDWVAGRPYLVAGPKAGAEILAVDGLTVQDKMERLRPFLRGFSSERAYRRAAAQQILNGEDGTAVAVELRMPGGETQTLSLKRERGAPARRPMRTTPFPLTRQRFVHFGRHSSGAGYIQIESFNGGEEIAGEFDRALGELRKAPALLLDIRDNPGGFGTAHPRIVGRFLNRRTLVGVAHIKNGPGHGDLQRRETYFGPSGPWQYKGPVVLLVNDVTGSAADLFACYMRSSGRVKTVGSTTHGNLSGVAAYAVLPCGLAVRISNGYITDSKGRAIEGNGSEPDIAVSPGIEDVLAGRDPVLEKAAEALRR